MTASPQVLIINQNPPDHAFQCEVLERLSRIERNQEQMGTQLEALAAALALINTSTNNAATSLDTLAANQTAMQTALEEIGTDIDNLLQAIRDKAVTDDLVNAATAAGTRLDGVATGLGAAATATTAQAEFARGIASKSPEQPVPVPVPDPVPPFDPNASPDGGLPPGASPTGGA